MALKIMTDRKSKGVLQHHSGGVVCSSENSGSIFKRGIAALAQDPEAEACFQRARAAWKAEDFSMAVLVGLCLGGERVSQNFAQALMWYRKAADLGHAEARHRLGFCYFHGAGVEQDRAQAVLWYRKAADQGHAEAQRDLGSCYACGWGVTQDYAHAVPWTRKAADQGHAGAQYYLGVCYESGRGVTRDNAQAVQWYRKAADQNFAMAQDRLGLPHIED
jgi:hypothetical protein